MHRLRLIAPLIAAAALTVAAFATVESAGCDDPAHYERDVSGPGYVLVGGCVAPGDLVLPPPPVTTHVPAPAPSESGASRS